MADPDELKTRLARLGGPPDPVSGTSRILSSGSALQAFSALLREIGQTQLARTVTFTNGRGETLVLHVKAGRVAKLVAAPAGSPDVVDQPLSGADAHQNTQVCEILRAFAHDATQLCVQTSLSAPVIPPTLAGVCPKDFELFAPADHTPKTGPDSIPDMTGFWGICRKDARAWIRVEGGQIVDRQGEAGALSRLDTLARGEIGSDTAEQQDSAQDICVIICGAVGEAILSGRRGGHMAFASFPAKHMALFVAGWQNGQPRD